MKEFFEIRLQDDDGMFTHVEFRTSTIWEAMEHVELEQLEEMLGEDGFVIMSIRDHGPIRVESPMKVEVSISGPIEIISLKAEELPS